MTTKRQVVSIPSNEGVILQGQFIDVSTKTGVVLCHPHPLYGGSMENNVLFAAEESLVSLGMSCLRFNFRGVGKSTGRFGKGIEEAYDVISACTFVRETNPEMQVHVVAYSFGVFAFLHATSRGLHVDSSVLVSPPLSAMDFTDLLVPQTRTAVIVGDRDEYCHQNQLDEWLNNQPGGLLRTQKFILEDTDHFYSGSESEIKNSLVAFFSHG